MGKDWSRPEFLPVNVIIFWIRKPMEHHFIGPFSFHTFWLFNPVNMYHSLQCKDETLVTELRIRGGPTTSIFHCICLISTDSAEWILPSLCKQMAWVQFTSIIDSNFTLTFSTTQQPACSWSAYHIYFCFDLFCFALLPIFHSKYSPLTGCNFPIGASVNINRL